MEMENKNKLLLGARNLETHLRIKFNVLST